MRNKIEVQAKIKMFLLMFFGLMFDILQGKSRLFFPEGLFLLLHIMENWFQKSAFCNNGGGEMFVV